MDEKLLIAKPHQMKQKLNHISWNINIVMFDELWRKNPYCKHWCSCCNLCTYVCLRIDNMIKVTKCFIIIRISIIKNSIFYSNYKYLEILITRSIFKCWGSVSQRLKALNLFLVKEIPRLKSFISYWVAANWMWFFIVLKIGSDFFIVGSLF